MPLRRLLVYTDAHESAATLQIRIEGALGDCGYDLVYAHDEPRQAGRLAQIVRRDVDAVVVHRGIRKRCGIYAALLEAARRFGKPVIYDTDDLLIRVCQTHPDYPVYRARLLYALKALLDADYVVASTDVLADQLTAFHPHVTVIPNRLPAALWRDVCLRTKFAGVRRQADRVTIGYIASDTHRPDLQLIEDALLAVLSRHQGKVRFLSVGVPLPARLRSHAAADELVPPQKVTRDYREFVSFVADLEIDVGVAPLVDNPFNRCKSDVKFQEYSALGIPAVYSDLPPYWDRVQNGINGYLSSDVSQWVEHLGRLVESAELRRRVGMTAAGEIPTQWKVSSSQPAWDEVLARAGRIAQARHTPSQREGLGSIVDEILAYQNSIERRLKRTVEYQVGTAVSRLIRTLARWGRFGEARAVVERDSTLPYRASNQRSEEPDGTADFLHARPESRRDVDQRLAERAFR